jgi:hypothetical protein
METKHGLASSSSSSEAAPSSLASLPRMDVDDPALLQRLAHGLPVVITKSKLVSSLLKYASIL